MGDKGPPRLDRGVLERREIGLAISGLMEKYLNSKIVLDTARWKG
jgi:hypothetical protein